jgi:hypothetical protein
MITKNCCWNECRALHVWSRERSRIVKHFLRRRPVRISAIVSLCIYEVVTEAVLREVSAVAGVARAQIAERCAFHVPSAITRRGSASISASGAVSQITADPVNMVRQVAVATVGLIRIAELDCTRRHVLHARISPSVSECGSHFRIREDLAGSLGRPCRQVDAE